MFKRMIGAFSIHDLVIVSLMAALGIAVKPLVSPLSHMLTGPLLIPSGVVSGGIYMMFPVIARAATGRMWAATLTGFLQALAVMVTGLYGSHGVASLLTYTLPGLAADLVMWPMASKPAAACFFGAMAANVLGAFSVNIVIFSLPLIPLLLMLCVSALSGGLGGLLAWNLIRQLRAMGILR